MSYDVRGIVQPMTNFVAPDIADQLRSNAQGGEPEPFGRVGESQQAWDEDGLASLVQEVIEPSSWERGEVGIQAEAGFLYVRQTGAVHHKVRGFLDSLR